MRDNIGGFVDGSVGEFPLGRDTGLGLDDTWSLWMLLGIGCKDVLNGAAIARPIEVNVRIWETGHNSHVECKVFFLQKNRRACKSSRFCAHLKKGLH